MNDQVHEMLSEATEFLRVIKQLKIPNNHPRRKLRGIKSSIMTEFM